MRVYYPVFIWLTTITLGALLISFRLGHGSILETTVNFFLLSLIYGLLCSFPTFLATLIAYALLLKSVYSPIIVKIILAVISIIGHWLTIYYLLWYFEENT